MVSEFFQNLEEWHSSGIEMLETVRCAPPSAPICIVPFIGLIFALQMPCVLIEWFLAMERAVGKGNLLGRDDIIRNLPRHSSWLRWYQRRPIGSSPPLLSEVNGGESGRNFNV